MLSIIYRRRIYYILSGILIVASLLLIGLGGLKLGIDFTGGSLLRVKFSHRPALDEVKDTLKELNYTQAQVQTLEQDKYILRLPPLKLEEKQKILEKLKEKFQGVEEESFESVGPTIGQELRRKAIVAIILVLIGIILYIAWAFRAVSKGPVKAWVWGLIAIITLFHDVLIITGFFALLGLLGKAEVNTLFVTALLTILGYSVNDTIVVFDRVRENLKKNPHLSFEEIVNLSVNQTLIRSLNTSLTTLFVLLALFLFGGSTLKNFVLALMLGVIIGTYSSIFIASPFLVTWAHLRKRFF